MLRAAMLRSDGFPEAALFFERSRFEVRIDSEHHCIAAPGLVAWPVPQAGMVRRAGVRECDPCILDLLGKQVGGRAAADEARQHRIGEAAEHEGNFESMTGAE